MFIFINNSNVAPVIFGVYVNTMGLTAINEEDL